MSVRSDGAVVLLPSASAATTATQTVVFDRDRHDYAKISVIVGTHATNGAAIGTLKITEHDTSSSVTDHADIVALTGGTATSTSVGFVIPGAAALGPGGVIEFNIDLRKRKKILGLQITPGTTTMQIAVVGHLTRSAESADTAAEKSAQTLHSLTSATAVGLVVTA
jgi:hypothetical protein